MDAAGYCLFETPIGACGIAWGAQCILGLLLPDDRGPAGTQARMQRNFPTAAMAPPPPWVESISARIRQLLEGVRDDLSNVPLDMTGLPPFHRRVYEIARTIPPGRVLTYGEVAHRLGEPGAARAVGQALGHNPFAPVIPCHRVLAANRRGGGFSAGGGVATKLRMLEIERAQFGAAPGLFDDMSA
ncbi:MAG: methylated-DNA--[protein]-cysteine S-methyltransferase [Haliea sp.]|nr:MAG: methylated-DNA--[protein]-cysteine S-methyltransferase [Haliea sp.]